MFAFRSQSGIRAVARATTLLIATTLVTLTAFAPSASATSMHCSQGYCHWGYNFVGPQLNAVVNGGWNYWDDEYVDKTSGGRIGHGFNVQAGGDVCIRRMSGADWWYGYPSTLGCGGYIAPVVGYVDGNTSYLYIDALVW